LLKIKGFDLAIKAFKIFSEEVSKTQLVIIGQGPQFSYLKNLIKKLNLQNKVEIKKWLPREEFLLQLTRCDVFLFPSLRDGGGQVVVEALAAQKPVICLDLAGPAFHIQEKWGIKISPSSPQKVVEEMAKALKKTLF
jgi:glycosyltransferase involved in cell wall biosynthesis